MDIRRVTELEVAEAAGHLFDAVPPSEAAGRFLAAGGHHVLVAYVDGVPAGMVTGVEMTRPDEGAEMFLCELGVDERFRGHGVERALASALARLARQRGLHGLRTAIGQRDERPQSPPFEDFDDEVDRTPSWDEAVSGWTPDR
ncbi:GNAT family N-acetyltransferase [Nonomuraea lactucae]|uniref:GNAT family N-acetyltransferase n=1 Tax=Nonomuraea lactucae TaxID=2249762 RepID=UPI000DE4F4E8|nr:GNAT family N-acetyltransferase [Nonomuraea lactucae]